MFHRVTATASSVALVLAAAAVVLTPTAAHAEPAPTFSGHVQVVVGTTIIGCVGPGVDNPLARYSTDTSSAYRVSIAEGEQQNLVLADDPSTALGVYDHDSRMTRGSIGNYTFLTLGGLVPAGSTSSMSARQSAIWEINPSSSELSATYVWDDSTTEPVGMWSYDGWARFVGISADMAGFIREQGDVASAAKLFLGEACSGQVPDDVPITPQAITFTSVAPTSAYPGQTYTVAATGGASGNAVTFTSATSETCEIDGATVTFTKPGTCTINADQAAAEDFSTAPTVSQDITVTAIESSVALSLADDSLVTGQTTTATAEVDVVAGAVTAAGGTVQFAVDGTDVGDPVDIDSDGLADSPELGGTVGSHQVTATYVPADATNFVGSTTMSPLTVSAATTATKVSVTSSDLTATVAPVAPGAGTPTGEVTFFVDGTKVGASTLTRGVATLTHSVATDKTHAVSASYAGDDDFNASSDSTSRSNPTIKTRVSSSKAARGGWYRTPVKVTFTCDAKGAELVTPCPKPVTVSKQGASSVSRTIRTADGGIATATAAVKVDRSKPRVSIKGVKARRGYFDAPKPTCKATDSVSGVQTCKVTSKRRGTKVVVTAKATDVAGNVRTKRVTYRLAKFTIRGAKKVGNTYRVKQGKTYTLQVRGAKARYVYATPAPGKPNRGSVPFKKAGKNTWTLGVTMSMTTSGTRSWNLGYTQNGKLHVIKVKVTG